MARLREKVSSNETHTQVYQYTKVGAYYMDAPLL